MEGARREEERLMDAPAVTIGVPVHNGDPYLEATLQSLLDQDHANLEIVVSDNGSTDGTESVVRSFAERDPRVRYHRVARNRGAAWNYNRVLELADGELFKWAAADDRCRPSFVSACVAELGRGPAGAVLAFPATTLIDADDGPMGDVDDRSLDLRQPSAHERLTGLLQNRFEWHPVFGVIRTDVLRRTGGIGSFLLADVALLAELCLVGAFCRVPEPLFLRRYHDGRSVVANATWQEQLRWYDPHAPERPVLPQARLIQELAARVVRAPLPAPERARCLAVVASAWAVPHWRQVGGEVKRWLPHVTPRRRPAPGSPARRGTR